MSSRGGSDMDREAPGTKTKHPSSMHKKGNGVVEPKAKSHRAACRRPDCEEADQIIQKTLTIPDIATVADACSRMATRRVDAALLTDSNVIIYGIITDKDVAMQVVAEGLKPEEANLSKVMTRNPALVAGDTLAMEALAKMVEDKFRHLPVVQNGEVVALLDITKCLYDAIARMECAADKGSAIAACCCCRPGCWAVSSE